MIFYWSWSSYNHHIIFLCCYAAITNISNSILLKLVIFVFLNIEHEHIISQTSVTWCEIIHLSEYLCKWKFKLIVLCACILWADIACDLRSFPNLNFPGSGRKCHKQWSTGNNCLPETQEQRVRWGVKKQRKKVTPGDPPCA